MSKRKTMDKAQVRERRNRLLESAAAAELSLTDGVREMRAIAGMTQEEFARHRGVSARAIKTIELGQGNPTVATLNRIGQFFGLEVAFVPVKRSPKDAEQSSGTATDSVSALPAPGLTPDVLQEVATKLQEDFNLIMRHLSKARYDMEHVTPGSEQAGSSDTPPLGNLKIVDASSNKKGK